jgi:hypothetical protein
VFPPVLYVGTLLLGLLLQVLRPVHLRLTPSQRLAGVILILASGAVAFWASRTMHRAGTNVLPSKPALTIVTDDPSFHPQSDLCSERAGLSGADPGVQRAVAAVVVCAAAVRSRLNHPPRRTIYGSPVRRTVCAYKARVRHSCRLDIQQEIIEF